MFREAANRIRDNRERLSNLDSFGGDGDHGTTMARAMSKVEEVLGKPSAFSAAGLLKDVGWAIMGVDGGATGPLFGTLFMSMADAAADKDAFGTGSLAEVFESGLAGVRKRTKAQVGDKTMIDALVPAVEALRHAATCDLDAAAALERAALAAEEGALSTKNLKARFGRAKNIGEQSVGSQDPGATSVALMFRGFADGIGGK
jgi:dihydroxyacetone kinase-like protein